MKNINETNNDQIWEQIKNEKRKDALIKKISRIAWVITLTALVYYLFSNIVHLKEVISWYRLEDLPFSVVVKTILPSILALGGLGLIVAILSTVGTFLRLRTTSLLEIQQRLTNLEQMVVDKGNND